jgi:hypothetical protein
VDQLAPLIPAPVIAEHNGILVVRDDLLEGGSKVRVAWRLLGGSDEWVFAGPSQGYAQLALAIACELVGKRATFFTAARKEPAPLTKQAMAHGLQVVFVPVGRINVVQARARAYCELTGARFIELGLKLPGMEDALYEEAAKLDVRPAEVWVTAGSGTLCRALARAWPDAAMNAVQVGMAPHLPPGAKLWKAPEPFDKPATGELPPFPSAINYDAKAWRFVAEHASPGALFWNVGA